MSNKFLDKLIKIIKETPNDKILGKKVRFFYYENLLDEQSKGPDE
tara:strand:- start:1546 stop:1680 length:135 start_codon:yes stop_codon:yes gene_type:complete